MFSQKVGEILTVFGLQKKEQDEFLAHLVLFDEGQRLKILQVLLLELQKMYERKKMQLKAVKTIGAMKKEYFDRQEARSIMQGLEAELSTL